MKIEKKIGKRTYEFTVEGSNLHEAVVESKKLSFYDVYACGVCKSDDLILDAHVAQEKFKYTTVKCNACKASLNFGSQTAQPDIFYIRTKDDGQGGKIADWKAAPVQEGQAPAPQAQAAQQVQNYSQQPNGGDGQPRQ